MTTEQVKYFVNVHDCIHEPLLMEVSNEQNITELYEMVDKKLSEFVQQKPDKIELYYMQQYIDPLNAEKPTLQSYEFPIIPVSIPQGMDWAQSHTLTVAVQKSTLPLYILNDATQALATQLTEFKKNGAPNQGHAISFPSTMSSTDRKFVHAFAEQLGLNHQSSGKGDARFIKVTFKRSAPEQKTGLDLGTVTKKSSKLPKGMSAIIDDFLYLGSGVDANDKHQMKNNQISHILNVCKEWQNVHDLPYEVKIKHLLLEDVEHQVIHDEFDSSFEFINGALTDKKKILVHCAVGKSRSASFVIAYMMKSKNMNLREAYEHVLSRRSIIKPNDGFMKQLMLYEKLLFDGKYTDETTGLSTSLPWEFLGKPVVEKKKKEVNHEMIAICEPIADAEITDENMIPVVERILGGVYEQAKVKELLREYCSELFEKYKERVTSGELDTKILMKQFQDKIRSWYSAKCQ